ncbi:MAG: SprT-like domain-containing protein [Chloroflexi bacterium]|nr:SprT-like domain-containing protein [Chloroflexota bacterium]
MPLSDYARSNRYDRYDLTTPEAAVAATHALLAATSATDRTTAGSALLSSLSEAAGVECPRLLVLDRPRPSRRREGRLVYQKLGTYSPRTHTIRIYNKTAQRELTVAPRTLLETLVHELIHHWDFRVLKLRRSLHTSGFYHRLGHLKRALLAGAEGKAPLQYPRSGS